MQTWFLINNSTYNLISLKHKDLTTLLELLPLWVLMMDVLTLAMLSLMEGRLVYQHLLRSVRCHLCRSHQVCQEEEVIFNNLQLTGQRQLIQIRFLEISIIFVRMRIIIKIHI